MRLVGYSLAFYFAASAVAAVLELASVTRPCDIEVSPVTTLYDLRSRA